MYGYVRPPAGILSEEELERFRRMYCGLCHTLGQRYGTAARFILNYDFTYLAILLSGGDEGPSTAARCMVSPLKKRDYLCTTDALALAADESVILAYWQLICSSTRRQLAHLAELEAQPCALLDPPADAFASLLGAAAQEVDHPVRRRVLEQILYHLGRWIYLIDAADDLKKDAKTGSYNPVALRYGLRDGVWTPECRREFTATLDHSVHMITTALELWDFGVWTPVLESTFYTGLFHVGKSVLDGTFRSIRRGQRKKRKNGEETA